MLKRCILYWRSETSSWLSIHTSQVFQVEHSYGQFLPHQTRPKPFTLFEASLASGPIVFALSLNMPIHHSESGSRAKKSQHHPPSRLPKAA